MGFRAVRLAVVAAAFVLLGLGQAELSGAAVGDVRADIAAGAPGGVSVAFDGQNLYYTDRNGVLLKSVAASGSVGPSVPIVGAAGLNALTYDVTHDLFWAVDSTGLAVYQLTRDGLAWPQFVLVPALDLPGLCDLPTGCSAVVSGLAYDAKTDSLWYAPQSSQRVYHLTTAGQLIGYFDTNETSGALFPDCLTNGVSGLAAGADSLYVAAGDCAKGFRYTKSDSLAATKLSAFKAPAGSGDVACDSVTFAATVLWFRSLADGHLRAVEVAPGTCVFGGGVPLAKSVGWMSGAGEAFDVLDPNMTGGVQHAFHLLCNNDPFGPPNSLVVNWKDFATGNHYSFHLKKVLSVACSFDPKTPGDPPPCDPMQTYCFNTINGDGTGRLMGRSPTGEVVAGAAGNNDLGYVIFRFTDHGEPNRKSFDQSIFYYDWGEINVSDMVRGGILQACGCIRANYQAHPQSQ
ncbi:MAG TPA: hypothetical protein VGQ84_00410 [Gaiellaceae bacterium]|jgi:hypothetical protein|nr:hypothetical protein [Gaiellaceae bacterium]